MTINKFVVDLPFPPSENALYSTFINIHGLAAVFRRGLTSGKLPSHGDVIRHVKRVLTPEGRRYKQDVSSMMNAHGITTALREFIELHEIIGVSIYVYRPNWYTQRGRPNKNAGDSSNRIKVLQDVLFETIGIDDCHAFFTGAWKLHGPEPKVSVVFAEIPGVIDEF